MLEDVGVRSIQDYNELAGLATMPNIVIVIDEMADIMLFAPKEVEDNVTRIAQMARAVGIHLVLATQRPSVDVITGLIKANMPTRIAFNVSSVTDSRVILDTPGAEKLLGKGDMLYLSPNRSKPQRIQGTYVDAKEIDQLIDFLKSGGKKPNYEEEITSKYQVSRVGGSVSVSVEGEVDRDERFDEAVQLFSTSDSASSSAIQRHLSVGYARAARILDQLEEAGFVGPAKGSKAREVFRAKIEEHLAMKDF
jgi:S-DNA-T family DNA segregation ATPase FtsK/SpoIIIE